LPAMRPEMRARVPALRPIRKGGQECPRPWTTTQPGRSSPAAAGELRRIGPTRTKSSPLVGGGAWTENTTCGCQPTQGGHARLKVERDGQEIRPGIVDAILGGRTIGLIDNRLGATLFRQVADVELDLRADIFSQQIFAEGVRDPEIDVGGGRDRERLREVRIRDQTLGRRGMVNLADSYRHSSQPRRWTPNARCHPPLTPSVSRSGSYSWR